MTESLSDIPDNGLDQYAGEAIACVVRDQAAASWIILCDFDGTISQRDVTDSLLAQFGQDGCDALEAAWEAGQIGSRECMSGQLALLDASKTELDACLEGIAIDPAFKDFVSLAEARGIEVRVLSDGLDYAIHRILGRYDLDYLPVAANRLEQTGERSWRLQFPHAQDSCRQASGNCKCAHLELRRQQHQRVIFVGDGSSDFCASGMADVVFAKDRLIDYCRAQDIDHIPIHGFADAISLLPCILHDVPVPVATAGAVHVFSPQVRQQASK